MWKPRVNGYFIIDASCVLMYNFISGLHDPLHPIFSPKDFLEVLIKVKNPNFIPSVQGVRGGEEGVEGESQPAPGLMKLQMNVQSLFKLVSEWVLLPLLT